MTPETQTPALRRGLHGRASCHNLPARRVCFSGPPRDDRHSIDSLRVRNTPDRPDGRLTVASVRFQPAPRGFPNNGHGRARSEYLGRGMKKSMTRCLGAGDSSQSAGRRL